MRERERAHAYTHTHTCTHATRNSKARDPRMHICSLYIAAYCLLYLHTYADINNEITTVTSSGAPAFRPPRMKQKIEEAKEREREREGEREREKHTQSVRKKKREKVREAPLRHDRTFGTAIRGPRCNKIEETPVARRTQKGAKQTSPCSLSQTNLT